MLGKTFGGRHADGSLDIASVFKAASPSRRRPGILLVIFTMWVFLAEFLDMFMLHQAKFSSSAIEAAVDGIVLLLFLSPAYFLFYVPLTVRWKKEREAQRQVQQLNHRLFQTAEEERRKLALELHDHFGQAVTEMQCRVEKVLGKVGSYDTTTNDDCLALQQSVVRLGNDIRKFVSALRPEILDDLGLVEALKWHVKEVADNHTSLRIDFETAGIKKRFSPEIEITLYRVCQEALHNVVKHSSASHASVTLTYSHPMLILTVRDDGECLSGEKNAKAITRTGGLGLLGMRERLTAVGGTFEMNYRSGEKTTIRAMIPVKEVE